MTFTPSKRNLSRFRRVASMGLSPQAASVALLDVLHSLVPSSFNRIGFCDSQFRITNGYSENADLFRFFDHYFSDIDGKVDYWPKVETCLRQGAGVGYYLPYQTSAYYSSSYFHDVEKPLGSHHQLDATIGDGGRVYGNLVLSRTKGHEFKPEEIALLRQLIPYFAHALAAPISAETEALDEGDHALLLVDERGEIVSADAAAVRFTWMLHHSGLEDSDIVTKSRVPSIWFGELARRLCAIEQGQPGAPPSIRVENGWAVFRLRAERLYTPRGERAQISVRIQCTRPRTLLISRRLDALGLSTRQHEICQRVIDGQSQAEIARSLGLRPATVNGYLQDIYAKLNVNSRADLVALVSKHSDLELGTQAPTGVR